MTGLIFCYKYCTVIVFHVYPHWCVHIHTITYDCNYACELMLCIHIFMNIPTQIITLHRHNVTSIIASHVYAYCNWCWHVIAK